MAGKQYEVARSFRYINPKTGETTHHEVGDTYDGATDEDYFLDSAGPDGQGPLLVDKKASSGSGSAPPADKSASSDSSDSGNKEK